MIKHPSLLIFYTISCLLFLIQQPGKRPEKEPVINSGSLRCGQRFLASAAPDPSRPGRTGGGGGMCWPFRSQQPFSPPLFFLICPCRVKGRGGFVSPPPPTCVFLFGFFYIYIYTFFNLQSAASPLHVYFFILLLFLSPPSPSPPQALLFSPILHPKHFFFPLLLSCLVRSNTSSNLPSFGSPIDKAEAPPWADGSERILCQLLYSQHPYLVFLHILRLPGVIN